MKKQHWFLVLLLVWCMASALWYLYGTKGVKTAPEFFSPQAALISVIEIVAMLLVACLIGYAVAWAAREEAFDEHEGQREKLQASNSQLTQTNVELKHQIEQWRNKHQHDIRHIQQKAGEIVAERNKLRERLGELELTMAAQQQDSMSTKIQLEQLETEAGTLRYRVRQLEYQNKEYDESNAKLKQELELLRERRERPSASEHPFVRPVEPDQKDNLTEIKGIGPFIEKRLNMLGIYTFKQLSELTPELVDRVGNAIEFFPGRIERENWIGQARHFTKG